ncbi:unnamed protein product [Brachionus calyciflorus]|uniref:F-box domain-containing protein n=1 Tax=Brachionus calyciflorus TaxID=104777 RepID=A0A814FTF6_9BILA|nr:unnamed protein product [Brachionus calyciflorus]
MDWYRIFNKLTYNDHLVKRKPQKDQESVFHLITRYLKSKKQLLRKMGLLLSKLKQIELGNSTTSDSTNQKAEKKYEETSIKFPDLKEIPAELSLQILKYLNATDLCLAACVWSSLANDDTLWQGLCRSTWGYLSIYEKADNISTPKNFRRIFMLLDEATLTFNIDWQKGLEYLFRENLLEDNPIEIARFINSTQKLNSEQKKKLFEKK